MPRISGQILIYLVVGAVLLLVGLSSIRGEKSASEAFAVEAPSGTGSSSGGKGSGGFEINAGDRKLIVDVAGAVRRPGVYRFEHGARVIDAIRRAGGETGNAVVGAINRAATLTDGQQVVVPSAGTSGGPGSASATPGAASGATDAPVSLGSATQGQLEEIDGIGPVTARKIIEFRDSQGGLGSVDELDQISGIGPVTMESLRSALSP